MKDGADHEDDLAWAPPSGPRQPDLPDPERAEPLAAEPPTAEPPTPQAGRIDQGGAAVTAGLFGALAGIALPPLLFWVGFSLLSWLGLPDGAVAVGALVIAFGIPIGLFVQVIALLGRSSPRYDGARTALTVAASASMGMWVFLAVIATISILVLRGMA